MWEWELYEAMKKYNEMLREFCENRVPFNLEEYYIPVQIEAYHNILQRVKKGYW